jgi:hypothetical protein
MYKNTDVKSLGQKYTVSDSNGKHIKTIQIIPHTEILSAALGSYTEEFGSISSYLEKSISTMSGFEEVDYRKILWYATHDEEVTLAEVIEYAVVNGYDKIILEHLEISEE